MKQKAKQKAKQRASPWRPSSKQHINSIPLMNPKKVNIFSRHCSGTESK